MRITRIFIAGLALTSSALAGASLTLLPNQDFESPQLGWGLWPAGSESKIELDGQVFRAGKQSLRVTAVQSGDRAIVNCTATGFKIGALYRISVWIRKDASVPDSAVSYFINYRGGETNAIQSRAFPYQLRKARDGEWTRWSGLFITPRGAAAWQFCLGVEHTVGRVWFDDIQIEDLGSPQAVTPDVWSYLPLGVQVGSRPLKRFLQLQSEKAPLYLLARTYNKLLFRHAFAERGLRDLERACFYTGKPVPRFPGMVWKLCNQALNETYRTYGQSFKARTERDLRKIRKSLMKTSVAIDTMRRQTARSLAQVRPTIRLRPPHKLGRQPRATPPFSSTGQMKRLLFGAWSPTAFAEFEQPFDFEFHSSAPGAPKTYTEGKIDLSNVTAACDRIEQLGYRGTFSYLMFGIHDLMYAPKWLLDKHKDDPDFFKVSADGLKGRSRGKNHSLNYFHPAVKQYIRDYLRRYAEFCRHEPRVLFHEIAQEASIDFTTAKGRRESGYGPHALAAFHSRLQDKYGSIDKLNARWGATYASFAAIQPPPDPYVEPRQAITPLVAEFEAFREDAYFDYLKLIYDSLKAGDPDTPVVARHSSLLRGFSGARAFESCDVLCYHNRAPAMQMMNVYLNSLNRYHGKALGYMEDFWGVQEERTRTDDERVQRRALAKHVARTCIWGRTLQMKWYAYTTGSYITTYNGNWMNPRYDVTTMRYCAPALAVAKRKMEQFDWVLTHSTIAPSRILVLEPSATMRNERPSQTVYGELLGWRQLLYRNGWLYELVPGSYVRDGRCKLEQFDVVVLPQAKYLCDDLQTKLAAFVKAGGALVCTGKPGEFDEIARPSGKLLNALRMRTEEWAAAGKLWGDSDAKEAFAVAASGQGKVVACRGVAALQADAGREGFLSFLERNATRAAWAEGAPFEVVLRVTEDGQRYVFILNPDVDETRQGRVRVAAQARAALDVSIPGACPVKLKRSDSDTSFDVRLAPGDCAVVVLLK